MRQFKELLRAEHRHSFIIGIVFILYILLGFGMPLFLANLVDNVVGNILVVLLALSVFTKTHPVVGLLGLVAAYELIRRASERTGTFGMRHYLPSEQQKIQDFSKYNDYPVTLEEEVVDKMAPLVRHEGSPNLNYKPVLDGLHDAAPVDYEGVI